MSFKKRYLSAAGVLICFLAAQAFQSLASAYWLPSAHSPQQALALYLLPINKLRAVLVGATILGLVFPYLVIALRYIRVDPISSLLGFVFEVGFVGAEIAQRSVDFLLVGDRWARAFQGGSAVLQQMLLQRFDVWNELTAAWYFPLLLAHLIASCFFLRATWTEWGRGGWFRLAPCAIFLNALRLLGRIFSLFAGQTWLDAFNNSLYFPLIFSINILLIAWFLNLYRQSSKSPERTS